MQAKVIDDQYFGFGSMKKVNEQFKKSGKKLKTKQYFIFPYLLIRVKQIE